LIIGLRSAWIAVVIAAAFQEEKADGFPD